MRKTIYILTGLLMLLVSTTWAQEPAQSHTGALFPEWTSTVDEFSNFEKSTINELLTVGKRDRDEGDGGGGGGGGGTCTIIPWFCGDD